MNDVCDSCREVRSEQSGAMCKSQVVELYDGQIRDLLATDNAIKLRPESLVHWKTGLCLSSMQDLLSSLVNHVTTLSSAGTTRKSSASCGTCVGACVVIRIQGFLVATHEIRMFFLMHRQSSLALCRNEMVMLEHRSCVFASTSHCMLEHRDAECSDTSTLYTRSFAKGEDVSWSVNYEWFN